MEDRSQLLTFLPFLPPIKKGCCGVSRRVCLASDDGLASVLLIVASGERARKERLGKARASKQDLSDAKASLCLIEPSRDDLGRLAEAYGDLFCGLSGGVQGLCFLHLLTQPPLLLTVSAS